MTNAPMPIPVEVQPPQHVREYITTVLEGEYDDAELTFVVYNDTPRDAWLTHLRLRTAEETEAHLTIAFMWGVGALWCLLALLWALGLWAGMRG